MRVFPPVAQLDRVLPSEGRGRAFESRRAGQYPFVNQISDRLLLAVFLIVRKIYVNPLRPVGVLIGRLRSSLAAMQIEIEHTLVPFSCCAGRRGDELNALHVLPI